MLTVNLELRYILNLLHALLSLIVARLGQICIRVKKSTEESCDLFNCQFASAVFLLVEDLGSLRQASSEHAHSVLE